jgi:hypothetical protein
MKAGLIDDEMSALRRLRPLRDECYAPASALTGF